MGIDDIAGSLCMLPILTLPELILTSPLLLVRDDTCMVPPDGKGFYLASGWGVYLWARGLSASSFLVLVNIIA